MAGLLRRLLVCEEGQDVIEYALLTAAIGLSGIAIWPVIVGLIGDAYRALDGDAQSLWETPEPGAGS